MSDVQRESISTPISAADLPIVREFIGEAQGHLAVAESHVLKLEPDPQDSAAVDAVFRCFHTIKGVAGFLNFTQISTVAHAAETLLNPVRKKELTLQPS